MAFLLIFCIYSNASLTSANAKEEEKLKVEVRDADYLKNLISTNKYLSRKIEELKKNNLFVDSTVRSIRGVDFIYYSNSDNTVVGLIELHKDLNSEIRINMVNSEPDTIEFIRENGDKRIVGKDENGQFNRILFETKMLNTRAPWWCSYVVGLVGTSVSTLYVKIAGLIGGPIAAIIVAGVSSVGWTYVSSKCNS